MILELAILDVKPGRYLLLVSWERLEDHTEGGKTHIGLINPSDMLSSLSAYPELARTAQEVEQKTMKMVDEAR